MTTKIKLIFEDSVCIQIQKCLTTSFNYVITEKKKEQTNVQDNEIYQLRKKNCQK